MPAFEVFFGSASVWIEGARAGRTLDPTQQCTLFDPPIGFLSLGIGVTGSGDVFIGGIPLPSLTDLAVGKVFEAAFAGVFAAARRARRSLRRYRVRRAIQRGYYDLPPGVGKGLRFAGGPPAFVYEGSRFLPIRRIDFHGELDDFMKRLDLLEQDMNVIRGTPSGRRMLSDLNDANVKLDISDTGGTGRCYATNSPSARVEVTPDPNGDYWDLLSDRRVNVTGAGDGSPSIMEYDPTSWPQPEHPGSNGPTQLFHEMNHARNSMNGETYSGLTKPNAAGDGPDAAWQNDWRDMEEFNTVSEENVFRQEQRDQGVSDAVHRPTYANKP
jgi:hypothetical protein